MALSVAGEVQKSQAASGKWQTLSAKSSPFDLPDLARAFPLPWSHYVLLIRRSRSPEAFAFYHAEALRGGWSVRQLQRQIDSQFYERTALSRNKTAMLANGAKPQPGDAVGATDEIRHPLVPGVPRPARRISDMSWSSSVSFSTASSTPANPLARERAAVCHGAWNRAVRSD